MVCCYESMANDYGDGDYTRLATLFIFYTLVVPFERKQKYLNENAKLDLTFSLDSHTESISMLEPYCSEFLIHAADVEGLQQGIDEELVSKLADWCTIPVTYAGGARHLQDLDRVKQGSRGKVDLTIGSALDIFGGSGVTFDECVCWNKQI
jgi:uncharacterized protein related to proFAR isomerase